jgi:RNA polymerase sigma-70 factor (ECF subfamily)
MNLQEIYQRYGGVVYRRARRLLGDDQAAKDACQEVFLRLLHTMPEFQQTSPVTWLYKVTTNHCLNLLRDARRRRNLLATQVAPLQSLVVQDAEGSTTDLLRGFSQELQEVAIYYFVDEMSQDEIAQVLGISQRTVCNRLTEFRSLAKSKWTTNLREGS